MAREQLLSDLPAAALLGMTTLCPALPHVNVTGRRCRPEGIVVHRRTVSRHDHFVRDGIPCTSPARTIVDLATRLSILQLERILIRADSLRIINRRRLHELAGRTLEVDFRWPSLRFVVEIDGYAFHGGRSKANEDRDRDQLLAIAG